MQAILHLSEVKSMQLYSMALGAVCPSLQTAWLIYELKIIKR